MSTPLDSLPPAVPSDGSSSPASTPSEAPPSIIRPEWVPLDEVAETWADLSVGVTNAHALQAVGNAFLALSFEMSAYRHYTQAYHGLWKCAPSVVAQGIGEALANLGEACQQWASTYLWLERFANEQRHEEETLAAMRDLFAGIREQQHRLWGLLLRLGEEQRCALEGQSLFVPLGHLSASSSTPAATAVSEKDR